jgi:rod shape-determining protein MreD
MTSLLPVATTLLAMLLSIEPLHIPGYTEVTPAFALMAAYYWTIYRPDLMPALALFTIGVLQDLLCGDLPGETAFLLLLCRAILLARGHDFVNRHFPFLWAGFALLSGGAMLFLWTLHSLLAGEMLDFRSKVFCAVLTISLFPVASFLLGRSERALMGAA